MAQRGVGRGFKQAITAAAMMGAIIFSPHAMAQNTKPRSVDEVKIPLRDVRSNGVSVVRFSATQMSRDAPSIILFGLSPEKWPKIRRAIQQAVYEGYPVTGIFYGSATASPSLEIYADGLHVTRPIDPNTISELTLTKLIRDVVREFYRKPKN